MKRLSLFSLTFLLALVPARLFAKAATSRITIAGNHLKFEITNPQTLAQFKVCSGPGTSSTEPHSFIVDWSMGSLAAPPQGLPRYQVSFYSNFPAGFQDPPSERLIYVVLYELDPTTGNGYVYLPGKTDPWHDLDVSSITRGVEGQWFHAWSVWDQVAAPLINNGLARVHSLGPEASCFSIRRYRAKREASDSDVTSIVGVSTCIPANNVRFTAEPARYQGPDGLAPSEK